MMAFKNRKCNLKVRTAVPNRPISITPSSGNMNSPVSLISRWIHFEMTCLRFVKYIFNIYYAIVLGIFIADQIYNNLSFKRCFSVDYKPILTLLIVGNATIAVILEISEIFMDFLIFLSSGRSKPIV